MVNTMHRPDTEDRQDLFFGGHKWTFIAAAGVIGVMAAAVLGALLIPGGKQPPNLPAQTPPPAPPAVSAASPQQPQPAAPLTEAPAVQWRIVNKLALPYGQDGPATVTGQRFRRTPAGAVLAAVNGYLRANRGTPAEQRAAISYAFTAGPARQQLLATVPIAQLAAPAQVEGFREPVYNPSEALVVVALRYTDTAKGLSVLSAVELPLRWQPTGYGGDWRIDLDTANAAPVTIPNLVGYVPFSAVG